MIAFLLVGLVVSKLSVVLEGSAWQDLARLAAVVAVVGSIFLLDWLCVRWLYRKQRDSL